MFEALCLLGGISLAKEGFVPLAESGELQLMGEKAAKVENFGTYLSEIPVHVTDKSLLQLSAQVMGHLVRSNVQLTAALVDNEVSTISACSASSVTNRSFQL